MEQELGLSYYSSVSNVAAAGDGGAGLDRVGTADMTCAEGAAMPGTDSAR